METAVAVRQDAQVINYEDYAMTPDRIVKQVGLIQEVMKCVMREGEHYGKIPGCGDKPTLLKPGAEKLSTTFRLAPSYLVTEKSLPAGHREYQVICTLTHIPTGVIFGQGVGAASTMESKYRYRKQERVCPKCGKETIIKGKAEYGGGYICFAKKGGCGAKFKEDDKAITDQIVGRVEYEDPADYYNTILKMAKKRAHVDATLTCTAASDIFTQDVEDLPSHLLKREPAPPVDVPKQEAPQDTPQDEPDDIPVEFRDEPKEEIPLISEPQRKRLFAISKKAGWPNDDLKQYLQERYGISHTSEIPKAKYEEICTWVESHTGWGG